MIDLNNPDLSFILLSSKKIDDLISVLYTKEFQVTPIKGYYRGNYEDSVIAWGNFDNDQLRNEIIFLLDIFNQDSGFIKYFAHTEVMKIFRDGQERPMSQTMYNTDDENMSYLVNGLSFSFVEKRRYWSPKSVDELKTGMIVEYFNNNRWNQKVVKNPKQEWSDMWSLLSKYDKLRVASKN